MNDAWHDYVLETDSDPERNEHCQFREEQIQLLLAKRLDLKKTRRFTDADRILEALNENGIYVQDKSRKYRVDGNNYFGRRKHYIRRGGTYWLSSATQDDRELVGELVEERARFKRNRDFYKVDDITEKLKKRYGVKVNDKKREYTIDPGFRRSGRSGFETENDTDTTQQHESCYVPTPLASKDHPTHTMSETTKKFIRDRLRDRLMARKKKDYKTADSIRDELVNDYSVVIDDRTMEWKVVDAAADATDSHDPFAREAMISQRSAFVQKESDNTNDDNNNDDLRTARTGNRDDDAFRDAMSRIVASNNDEDAGGSTIDPAPEESLPAVATTTIDSAETTITPAPEESLPATTTIDSTETKITPAPEESLPAVTTTTIDSAETTTPPAEETTGETIEELGALTVVVLKEKLRAAGLPVSGRKAELIDRLLSSDSNH